MLALILGTAGRAGFYEMCGVQLVVSDGDRFQSLAYDPLEALEGAERPGRPYVNLRMTAGVHVRLTEDGRHGIVATDAGCCDDHTRRIEVFDLSAAPRHVCSLRVELENPESPPPLELPTIRPDGCTP